MEEKEPPPPPTKLRRMKMSRSSFMSVSEANVCNGNCISYAKNGYVHIIAICVCLALSIVYYNQAEDWSVVDSVFFVITTVTSVGYGDDYPSTTRTRTFTIFLMLFGAIVLFGEVSQYLNVGMTKMDAYLKRSDIATLKKTEILFLRRAWHSAFWVIAYSLLGAMFLQLLQPEWSYFTALYFIVQTITSVGYGDIDFHADGTKMFLCGYILGSIGLLIIAFHNAYAWFENVKTLARRRKQLTAQSDTRFLASANGASGMNKFEVILAILARTGKLNLEKDVAPLLKTLDAVCATDSATMDAQQMLSFCEKNAFECAEKIAQIAQPVERAEALPISSGSLLTTLREHAMVLGLFSDADLYQAEAYAEDSSSVCTSASDTQDSASGDDRGGAGRSMAKTSMKRADNSRDAETARKGRVAEFLHNESEAAATEVDDFERQFGIKTSDANGRNHTDPAHIV